MGGQDLIKKYQRTQRLGKRRPLLSEIVHKLGRNRAKEVCKLEDIDWLQWYYFELADKYALEMPQDKTFIFGSSVKEIRECKESKENKKIREIPDNKESKEKEERQSSLVQFWGNQKKEALEQ